MLYLIRTFGRGKEKTALKVGFSDNPGKRFSTYTTSNPFFEIVSTREGTLKEETKLHMYLEICGFKAPFLREWFEDCPEVLSGFHERLDKIDKTIWNSRDSVFVISDFKTGGNKIKKEIYEELSEKFPGPKKKKIDVEWLNVKNQEILREGAKEWRKTKKLIDSLK